MALLLWQVGNLLRWCSWQESSMPLCKLCSRAVLCTAGSLPVWPLYTIQEQDQGPERGLEQGNPSQARHSNNSDCYLLLTWLFQIASQPLRLCASGTVTGKEHLFGSHWFRWTGYRL